MKYRIIIRKVNFLVEAVLIAQYNFLWFFTIQVEEECHQGDRDYIFAWVSQWVDTYCIPAENIDDRMEVQP